MADTTCIQQNSDDVQELFKDVESIPEVRTDLLCCCPDGSVVNYCSSLYSTGLLATMLDTYFSDPNNLVSQSMRDMIIADHPYVTTKGLWDGTKAGYNPRIIVEYCGSKAANDLAINKQIGYNIFNSGGEYTSAWTLAHAFYCISPSYNASLMLSNEVRWFLHHNHEAIQALCGFRRFRVLEEQKPQAITSSNSTGEFCVVISTMGIVVDQWFKFELAPVLKRIAALKSTN